MEKHQEDLTNWIKEFKVLKTKIKKQGGKIFTRMRFLKTTTLKNNVLQMMKKEGERDFD